MEKKVVWTDEARFWLEEIFDFIAIDNPTAAERTVLNIIDKGDQLSTFYNRGFWLEDFDDIRFILYGHYRIAYSIGEKNVYILGVYEGSLDIKRHLKV